MKIINFKKLKKKLDKKEQERSIILEEINHIVDNNYSYENFDYALLDYIEQILRLTMKKLVIDSFLVTLNTNYIHIYEDSKTVSIQNQEIIFDDDPFINAVDFDILHSDKNQILYNIIFNSFKIVINIKNEVKTFTIDELSIRSHIAKDELNISNFKSLLLDEVNYACADFYKRFLIKFYKTVIQEKDIINNPDKIIVPTTWPFTKGEYLEYLKIVCDMEEK